MIVKQFEYKPLSHFSYALLCGNEIALVDPERDPSMYYKFAEENNAKIVAVFETHPHADFVSSHLQIHKQTGAILYTSKLVDADYPHTPFDANDSLQIGNVNFSALNTPGHSPDSITIVAKSENKVALFTGDTLFIGDVGRPDLREKSGNQKSKRLDLAKAMYNTIQTQFTDFSDDAIVYPAHGAGSLCGKNMSSEGSSTLGEQRETNWAFKTQSQDAFVNHLLDSQPFIPHYFGFNVDLNKAGAENLNTSISNKDVKLQDEELEIKELVIDTRNEEIFKKGHKSNSINIMALEEGHKFETWLGSIVKPEEPFSLVATSFNHAKELLSRVSKIGYENQLKSIFTLGDTTWNKWDKIDLQDFKSNKNDYTIVDIRNQSETNEGTFFENAITIPLHELRERATEIPTNKPIVVHCAGGYRSAAGSSIVARELDQVTVYDLGEAINQFK